MWDFSLHLAGLVSKKRWDFYKNVRMKDISLLIE